MRVGNRSKTMLVGGILALVLGACGNSGDASTGNGGNASSHGGADTGNGGNSSSHGGADTGNGGNASSHGGAANPGAGGTSGASHGSGGNLGTGASPDGLGGQVGTGAASGAGGITSGGSTALTPTGGTSTGAGNAGAGGEAARGMGGGGQSGSTAGSGGHAGQPSASGGVGGKPSQVGGSAGGGGRGAGAGGRSISFGTLLDADTVVSSAQALAESLAKPSSAQWRAKGDQHRTYRFAAAGKDEPYRVCVPTSWDGTSSLPLVMFLHGSGSDENTYLDQNSKQLVNLAEQHRYLLVSPLGDQGAYGNFLRLTAPFGDEAAAAQLMAQVTADSERTNELSEQDVINVLELVLREYPVDRGAMFLTGHSMGSGGTWYIGGKYAAYWQGIAPMSGPFVQKSGYPWDSVRRLSIFVTEGTQTPSVDASHLLSDWLHQNGFTSEYKEVAADHGGMIKLVLPDIFDFFDRSR